MSRASETPDYAAIDEWHVLAYVAEIPVDRVETTRLLGQPLRLQRSAAGEIKVWRDGEDGRPLPTIERFGYLWTTLGSPDHDLFEIPEMNEPDRRNLNAATIGIHVSAPRSIENFLDMGHFPYVHTDYLGVEPHTEVKDYNVSISPETGDLIATKCRFYQPRASTVATDGFEVEYIYRVPHPYCSVLYKANAKDQSRMDVIALFLQPVTEEETRANMLLSLLDDESTDTNIRMFQQLIFGQDKPILENQMPRRLPLDPRAEIGVKSDVSSQMYRRWLRERHIRYGTIPVELA